MIENQEPDPRQLMLDFELGRFISNGSNRYGWPEIECVLLAAFERGTQSVTEKLNRALRELEDWKTAIGILNEEDAREVRAAFGEQRDRLGGTFDGAQTGRK